jgi:hypothetical protein
VAPAGNSLDPVTSAAGETVAAISFGIERGTISIDELFEALTSGHDEFPPATGQSKKLFLLAPNSYYVGNLVLILKTISRPANPAREAVDFLVDRLASLVRGYVCKQGNVELIVAVNCTRVLRTMVEQQMAHNVSRVADLLTEVWKEVRHLPRAVYPPELGYLRDSMAKIAMALRL